MPSLARPAVVASLLFTVSGCCFGGSSKEHHDPPAVADPTPASPKATATTPKATATAPAANTTTPPAGGDVPFGNDGLPADIPSTRSPVPTVAEWGAVKREITVRKSTPLGCETKMVREWLRVSCRGKNDKGGTPLDVKKIAGCTGDTYTFASGGVTSIVTPVLRGQTCDSTFTWTHGANQLWVRWPNGAPRPTIAFQD